MFHATYSLKYQDMSNFDVTDWELRMSNALRALAKVQDGFLRDYWDSNGYPPQYSCNGKDDTPFPFDDYCHVYNDALTAKRSDQRRYYKPLVETLGPVRSLLRIHPAFAPILKMQLGPEAVHVGVLNGSTYTSVAQIVSGLMARQYYRSNKKFLNTAQELNSLLLLSSRQSSAPLSNDFDLGLDVDLFYGAEIPSKIELGKGYFIAPLSEFRDYIEPEWFRDRAPEQVKTGDLGLFFGIAAPFRWKPEIRHVHARIPDRRPRDAPPLFHRITAEFAELLSVVLRCPITWVYDFPGTVHKASTHLLGQHHKATSPRAGEFVGHFRDPFRKPEVANIELIQEAVILFSRKSETEYPTVAPLIHRFADTQRKFGRYAKEDQILDLAIIFERFSPEEKMRSKQLAKKVASTLGGSDADITKTEESFLHFYNIRSALIHGAKNDGDKKLLEEIDLALENGFRHARALLLKYLSF
jgi:hypothetical protein